MPMFNINCLDKESSNEKDILEFLQKNETVYNNLSTKEFEHLNIMGYEYSTATAIDELGLDDELINKLVEDYVAQIIRSKATFLDYLEILQEQKKTGKQPDYVNFRELAHKNLGVARNLRIEDAQKLIYELMTKDDLQYLKNTLDVLIACAIKLKPKVACETIKLIEIKSSISE